MSVLRQGTQCNTAFAFHMPKQLNFEYITHAACFITVEVYLMLRFHMPGVRHDSPCATAPKL